MIKNLAFFSAAGYVTNLTGCRNSTSSKGAPHLVVLGEDSSNLNAIATLAPSYTKQTGVALSFDKSAFDVAYQKANQDLMQGTGLYDILMQYNFSLASFVNNNWVVPLNELQQTDPNFASQRAFESDLFSNAWHEIGYYRKKDQLEEQAIGYPFAANTMLLVYNQEHFENSHIKAQYRKRFSRDLVVPTDWVGFRELAEFFTSLDAGVYGVAMEGANGGWLYYEWATVANGMGGGVMHKDRGWQSDPTIAIKLDTPENIAATNLYVGLKRSNMGDFYSVSGAEQRQIMEGGKVAMALMWSDYLWPLVQSPGGARFAFAPTPGQHSGLAGGSFFVNRMSRFKKEAAEFILYVMQKDQQVELMKKGLCSPLRSAYSDPTVLAAVPYAKALYTSLDRGKYFFEAGPDSELIQNVITNCVQKIWRGDIDAPAGLREATYELQDKRAKLFKRL
jgi:multiple sugar transport system substrate-binding protein